MLEQFYQANQETEIDTNKYNQVNGVVALYSVANFYNFT